ncbi:unnamed protein product [Medioppia subpectinata]|uniref:Uncharacterized protein n=1 Tax=Medioppia subpectinata TaxID=1979941 RepID=A0A7R9KKE5_9ACAR|nr:unnamed protein product [Medioppia subpectinata]CAG2105355.1 unnamed protein product [Medioppia subpectinata]
MPIGMRESPTTTLIGGFGGHGVQTSSGLRSVTADTRMFTIKCINGAEHDLINILAKNDTIRNTLERNPCIGRNRPEARRCLYSMAPKATDLTSKRATHLCCYAQVYSQCLVSTAIQLKNCDQNNELHMLKTTLIMAKRDREMNLCQLYKYSNNQTNCNKSLIANVTGGVVSSAQNSITTILLMVIVVKIFE